MLPKPKFLQTCSFCRVAPRPCTPGLLSYEKKVTKDSVRTFWFRHLRQKGALPPLDFPSDVGTFLPKEGSISEK